MAHKKPRILLALYARPKQPDSYHYALLVAADPAHVTAASPATKFHVKNTLKYVDGRPAQPWRFERAAVPTLSQEPRLLACVVIGKLRAPLDVVEAVLRRVPVLQADDPDPRGAAFECRTWMAVALGQLRATAHVAGLLDWETARRGAVGFVDELREQGRWRAGSFQGLEKMPIRDLLEDSGTNGAAGGGLSWARKLLKHL